MPYIRASPKTDTERTTRPTLHAFGAYPYSVACIADSTPFFWPCNSYAPIKKTPRRRSRKRSEGSGTTRDGFVSAGLICGN